MRKPTLKTKCLVNWEKFKTEAEKFYENPGGLNKNPLAIDKILKTSKRQ